MSDPNTDDLVLRAEELYATKLRAMLEADHMDAFVAIEPESGD